MPEASVVLGMRVEPTMREILLEQSELLGDFWELFVKHLKEMKGIW